MKEIKLTQGKVALVDDEDYKVLHLFRWHARFRQQTFYAVRNVPNPDGVVPRQKKEHMHRIVLSRKLGREITPGMECDHEDGNGLNNQRTNLFEKTRRENGENLHIAKTSLYLGVSWNKGHAKWRAQIWVLGKVLHLGYHETELEAALAREACITARPELMAKSNFIKK